MRSLPLLITALVVCGVAVPGEVAASESATANLVVSAQFRSRTSLKVSTELLQFDLNSPTGEAIAAVDFSAGARTREGGEVMLSVEPVRAIEGPGGAADVESAITFAGEGEGTIAGALTTRAPAVAARWSGSGLRTGRLVFSLRSSASGTYTLPVRFVLSTP